ncbi:hypothetical protein WJX75_007613 [Coccomyxa subellipsoidea]|uniref:Aminotransferase class I/classII large domain-containing protein n=1 Tax=Coccomyxa subellipsoidea TaxID=248742 RepID=A0ABR2YJ69_9CHLO
MIEARKLLRASKACCRAFVRSSHLQSGGHQKPHRRRAIQSRCLAEPSSNGAGFDTSLNSCVASVRPSKTMLLSDLASSLRESGVDVVSLAAGEPDFDTPQEIIDAGIEALRTGITHYTPNVGTGAIRAALVKKLADENGLTYAANEIVVTNGAKQAIWQSLLAVCSPGDEVLIPAPFWVSYPEMARLAGAEPKIIDCSADEGYLLTADQLRAALTPRSRLLILCTPSNPTGSVYPLSRLQELAEVVAQHPRLMVLSDEIYEHIIYPPAVHHSFAALPGMWPRTFTVNGFSKAFAMTGWRLGYLAAPRDFAKAAAIVQSQTTSGASSIAQHAALAALALGPAGGQPVAAMRAAFLERRDYVMERLQRIEGVRVAAPDGAFYVLPDLSAFFGPDVHADEFGLIPDADTLCRYILEKGNVALVPGDAFGAPDCLRISYAASLETLQKALDRMESVLTSPALHRPALAATL